MLSKLAAHAELGNEQARPAGRRRAARTGRAAAERLGARRSRTPTTTASCCSTWPRRPKSAAGRPARRRAEPTGPSRCGWSRSAWRVGETGPMVDARRRSRDCRRPGAGAGARSPRRREPPSASDAVRALIASWRAPRPCATLLERTAGGLRVPRPAAAALPAEMLRRAARCAGAPRRTGPRGASCSTGWPRLRARHRAALAARLDDERWYVAAQHAGAARAVGAACRIRLGADPVATHRRRTRPPEAIRLQLTHARRTGRGAARAPSSGPPGLVRAGLAAVQHECPPDLVDRVGAIAPDATVDEMLRVLAVRRAGPVPRSTGAGRRCCAGRRRADAARAAALAPRTRVCWRRCEP